MFNSCFSRLSLTPAPRAVVNNRCSYTSAVHPSSSLGQSMYPYERQQMTECTSSYFHYKQVKQLFILSITLWNCQIKRNIPHQKIQGAANAATTLTNTFFISVQQHAKVMDYATAATEWKINFPPRKLSSYIHYHISRYMTQTKMFYFQYFDFARGKA